MQSLKRLVWIVPLVLVVLVGCNEITSILERVTSPDTGTLKGAVTIGPLCPVEPCDLEDEQVAAIYMARVLFVYDQASKTKVDRVNLDSKGQYSLELSPGNYTVDVSDGEGRALPLDLMSRPIVGQAVPQDVTVQAGEVTHVNFDIDTGIR